MGKQLTGVVTSEKVDKTIVVTVRRSKTHPVYKKQYTVSKKFIAHDESNEAKLGDIVIISETRPISARKRHILAKIVERAPVRHVEEEVSIEELKSTPEKPAEIKADAQSEDKPGDKK